MLLHIRAWNRWRKRNTNNKKHKLLVLLKLRESPTLPYVYFGLGFEKGLKKHKAKKEEE